MRPGSRRSGRTPRRRSRRVTCGHGMRPTPRARVRYRMRTRGWKPSLGRCRRTGTCTTRSTMRRSRSRYRPTRRSVSGTRSACCPRCGRQSPRCPPSRSTRTSSPLGWTSCPHQAKFREEYERRQGLKVPGEDPEYARRRARLTRSGGSRRKRSCSRPSPRSHRPSPWPSFSVNWTRTGS